MKWKSPEAKKKITARFSEMSYWAYRLCGALDEMDDKSAINLYVELKAGDIDEQCAVFGFEPQNMPLPFLTATVAELERQLADRDLLSAATLLLKRRIAAATCQKANA